MAAKKTKPSPAAKKAKVKKLSKSLLKKAKGGESNKGCGGRNCSGGPSGTGGYCNFNCGGGRGTIGIGGGGGSGGGASNRARGGRGSTV